MKQIALIILLIATIIVGSVGSVGVTAQPTNETAESTPEYTERIPVDEHVAVIGHEYDPDVEVFRITLEADRPTWITLSESVQQPEGASSFSIVRERLLPGEQTITIPVPKSAGEAAVSITTSDSIDDGRGVYVSTGITQTGGPFEGTTATAGWFGGASVVFAMLLASAWQVKRKKLKQPEELT